MKAVLFDMDGVLWDSSTVHAQAFDEIARCYDVMPTPYEEIAGRSTEAAWHYILDKQGRTASAALVDELSTRKRELAHAALRRCPPLAAGLGAVAGLRDAGFAVGMVTGSSRDTASLLHELLRQRHGYEFDVVIDSSDVIDGKPSPEPYLRAASDLGVAPSQCWVLEDSAAGIASASAAGARVVHMSPSLAIHPHPYPVSGCASSVRQFVTKVLVENKRYARSHQSSTRQSPHQEVKTCQHAA